MGSVTAITIDVLLNACYQMLESMLKYFREIAMRKILTAGKLLTILPHLFDTRNKIYTIYVFKNSVLSQEPNKEVIQNGHLYVYIMVTILTEG